MSTWRMDVVKNAEEVEEIEDEDAAAEASCFARKLASLGMRAWAYYNTRANAERRPCQVDRAEFGSDSVWPWMERPSARPKNGRPLQNLLSTIHYGFVEAVPSQVLRDGTGTFQTESLPGIWRVC